MRRIAYFCLLTCVMGLNACNDDEGGGKKNNRERCDKDYEATCIDDSTAKTCKHGYVTEVKCGDSKVCSGGSCAVSGGCLGSEGQYSHACKSTDDGDVSVAYLCEGSADKGFEWVEKQEQSENCAHGCDQESGTCEHVADFEGDACTAAEDGACRDGFVVHCVGGRLEATQCDEGDFCAILEGSRVGGECLTPCDAGNVGQDVSRICKNNVYYVATCEQKKDTRGNDLYVIEPTNIQSCNHGCTENGCVYLHDNEGKKCTELEEFNQKRGYCDGSIALLCEGNTVVADDCGEKACIEYDNDRGEHVSDCRETCSESEVGTEEILGCMTLEGSLVFKTCVEQDGKRFWETKTRNCDYGCDPTLPKCYEGSAEDECNVTTYKPGCEGTKITRCELGRLVTVDCAERAIAFSGNTVDAVFTGTCVPTVDGPVCKASCTAEDVGKIPLVCDMSLQNVNLYGEECLSTGAGDYYWNLHNEYCAHGCNDANNDCKREVDGEGVICEPETFEDKCVGNYRLFCQKDFESGYSVAKECTGTQSVCGIYEGKSLCAAPCQASDVTGLHLSCDGTTSSGRQCIQSGSTYFWKEFSERCHHGCNADGSCVRIHDSEGQECNVYTYLKKCDGNYLLECDSNSIAATNCADSGKSCVASVFSASCQ